MAARRRFQREAQLASSLNHPHRVTVHDVGEFEGRQYLVTEFVHGGTLKDWARTERRPWRESLELLVDVADGLATAHEAGITHRDSKPANILIAKSGYAKLADFGLAKLAERPVPADGSTHTVTDELTAKGMVIGVIAYMSPEQASGKPLDARSDIFSFGVVLYEMLAGRRPFAGTTNLEIQTIVHGTPQPLGDEIPAAVRAVVERARAALSVHARNGGRDAPADASERGNANGAASAMAGTAIQMGRGRGGSSAGIWRRAHDVPVPAVPRAGSDAIHAAHQLRLRD